ncbi:uncharacterized protein LOC27208085 isoform X1 [Drosophila simulans]|uniref:uncharacterized protein LOC27208085 isoform X1 n=2 Tax=Drosophila simulans TaxID=7240 RepID=UPI00192CED6C|nr:uncharacterized protein LOC27208085 isoform X1 [Drosophila simulans]
MNSLTVIFGLLFVSTQIAAKPESECPEICPAIYMPVCEEAMINGKLVTCLFGNSCEAGRSACRHEINWRHLNEKEGKCETSPDHLCRQYL